MVTPTLKRVLDRALSSRKTKGLLKILKEGTVYARGSGPQKTLTWGQTCCQMAQWPHTGGRGWTSQSFTEKGT